MSFITLKRTAAVHCTLIVAAMLLAACGDQHTMAMKSQKAFEQAQKTGTPIAKGGHGGHMAMGSEEMSQTPGSGAAATSSAPDAMAGMDMSSMNHGDMKGMDKPGSKPGAMTGMKMPPAGNGKMSGMNLSGMNHGDMRGMDMSSSKPGAMTGMKMSGAGHGNMSGMDMPGAGHGSMNGMEMSGMNHGDMKGMDMGAKPGAMPGMEMSGMSTAPIVPQPKALQASAGQAAATLQSDPLDRPAASSVSAAQQSTAMNQSMSAGGVPMTMGSYVQRDVGQPGASPEPVKGMDPAMPGMKHEPAPQPHSHDAAAKASMTMYVCAAHPEIVRAQPGTCPDGTPLVKKEMQ